MLDWLLSHVAMMVTVLMTVLALGKILSERRTPQSLAAWLLVILLIPWVGLPLYLLFGGRKMLAMKEGKHTVHLSKMVDASRTDSFIEHTLISLGIPPATEGNRLEFEFDGVTAFEAVLRLIDSASERIDFATFIFAEDDTGRAVLARLIERARNGCQVRLLLDGFGCVKTPRRMFEALSEAGGEVAWFNPVLHRPFYGRTNLRNHRKMIVVDDRYAWSGGRNTAEEYLGPTPLAGRWRDLSFTLEGPAVVSFGELFDEDWAFATASAGEKRTRTPSPARGPQAVQVVPSGPDIPLDALLASILTAAYRAEHRIRIMTPYFVPPDSVTKALALAAFRGVQVEILLPGRSNHRLADAAREPHLGDIHGAGGRILLLPEMNHAKAIIFDDETAFFGSANCDERSLLLNYEVMAAIYSPPDVAPLTAWFDELSKACTPWQPTGGRIRQTFNGLAELAAPLL